MVAKTVFCSFYRHIVVAVRLCLRNAQCLAKLFEDVLAQRLVFRSALEYTDTQPPYVLVRPRKQQHRLSASPP
jgi:hypothetical protein